MVYRFRTFLFVLCTLFLPLLVQAADYTAELNKRYAPYADWQGQLELDQMEKADGSNWWRSPEAIRMNRTEAELPLSGLHLALDPGHIGGEWAEIEGRHFKINPDDFPVREGELVLEVARLVRAELVEMGAQVSLLRDGAYPLNPKPSEAYFFSAAERIDLPEEISRASFLEYGLALRRLMNRMSAVSGELIERARLVNEVVQPDALISLHINAAPWPRDEAGQTVYELVDSNHTHVLIFGCLSDGELSAPQQRQQLVRKMINGSGVVELELGHALGVSLGEGTALPASMYSGKNAVRLDGYTPYLWARNLMLLRFVQCPVVLLEPYIANSREAYPRIQTAFKKRHLGEPLADDDILIEYAQAVVKGLLAVYGPTGGD